MHSMVERHRCYNFIFFNINCLSSNSQSFGCSLCSLKLWAKPYDIRKQVCSVLLNKLSQQLLLLIILKSAGNNIIIDIINIHFVNLYYYHSEHSTKLNTSSLTFPWKEANFINSFNFSVNIKHFVKH